MPELVWDQIEDRVYESGLDRGVLYLPDGSAVPWNGLTAVIEDFDRKSSPVYFDGIKVNDVIELGDFSATMKAVTYPDEFIELEGLLPARGGLFYADQQPQAFGLCYRTGIGNAFEGPEVAYKIHILYNVSAIPSPKTYATAATDPNLVEFEWKLSAVPQEIPGFRPTAHIVIDSRDVDPWLLEDLENMLYGTTMADGALLPMTDLAAYINEWYRIQIVDNGDGTWTAISERGDFIKTNYDDLFTITGANAVYLDESTYVITDTKDLSEVPQIEITNHNNGTWSAESDHDGLIVMLDEDTFEIRNANVQWLNEYTYRITDTTDED